MNCSVKHVGGSGLYQLLWLEKEMLRLWELESHSLYVEENKVHTNKIHGGYIAVVTCVDMR